MPSHHKIYLWVAVLAGIVCLTRCALTVGVFNHTVDEGFHIAAAVGLYDAHKHVADVTHPPLAWLVGGFPLWRIGVHVPELRGSKTILGFPQIDAIAAKALFNQSHPYWTILTEARLAMLVFPAIAMLYLYLLGKWLVNDLVAMLAVIFFSTDPTLLGHSPLVNNDAAACAAFLAALYYGMRWIVTPTMERATVAGLVIGLALATKFTMVLLFPILAAIVLLRPIPALRAAKVKAHFKSYVARLPSVSQILVALVVGFVALWATYLFNVGKMQDQNFFDYTPKWNNIPAVIRNATIPMPSLFVGFLYQVIHSQAGHPSYLNGLMYAKGSKLFFLESLLIKEPLSLIGGFGAAVAAWWSMPNRRVWRTLLILLPAGIYFVSSMMGHVMIGVRHLLPIVPLLYLFVCFVMARGSLAYLVLVFIVAGYAETFAYQPEYIAFANAGTGGPRQLNKYFADSNFDWGQDLARLAEWFKTDPRARNRAYTLRVYGSTIRPLLTELGLNPDALDAQPHGLFAISASIRAGYVNFDPEHAPVSSSTEQKADYSWLRDYPRIAQIGSTIEVYDLGQTPATNVAQLPAIDSGPLAR